jgi:hypothetical protein
MSTDEPDDRDSGKNPRHSNGRYRKGHSGNRKGRPPKARRVFTDRQLRADVLNAMEEETTITVNGKQRKVPRIVVIYQQLVRKGAAGDVRCMFKAIDLRQQLVGEHTAALNELAETVVRARRAYRAKPGDFTDDDLTVLREAHRLIKDPHRID